MKKIVEESRSELVILFAGDSGDGIQLTGGQFTETVEQFGNDIATFPNYPAEIRAPVGTLSGVSGFQLKMGAVDVYTPGDQYDVLVVMNAAALKVNLANLKKGGVIIANSSGFDAKNLKQAKYIDNENPLEDHSLDGYDLHIIDVTKLTREALKDSALSKKQIDRCKNMFVLGFIYWMFSQKLDNTIKFIETKFSSDEDLREANITVLKTGYHYGDTSETFSTRFKVKSAKLPPGNYRNVNGNQAIALGLTAAAVRNDIPLFYGSYPITPASEVLHELSKHKHLGVKTFQAEDEIAAACSAIGASFGGALGTTATSGPGVALKSEALGLATILEIPLVCINVQRGGPSTGLPTKTEQADLYQAIYGRNGEAPMIVMSASSPSDCFEVTYEACKLAVEHMTPVMLLSDGYIANGAEPWRYPDATELPIIKKVEPGKQSRDENGQYLPYQRNEKGARSWVAAGTAGYEHRIGGLEKEINTGNVSYDPENHEQMIKLREEKIRKVADYIPELSLSCGEPSAELMVLGWGSSFGAIETAVRELIAEGYSVAHAHLRNLFPMPKNTGELLRSFPKILIPELNRGQLASIIRQEYLLPVETYSKLKGLPFQVQELKDQIKTTLSHGK